MTIIHPTPQQLEWQNRGIGVFVHFGLNTYFGKEWSNGTLPASAFNPVDFDAAEWVRSILSWGANYVVVTAKHHDGFCLWQTDTTDYSVANSPWKDGRGDIIAEVAEECHKQGLGLGLYLSPWDRNTPLYSDNKAYDDFYIAQLTELCTRYGPLMELWFDGAGSEGHEYNWPRIMSVIDEHQPHAMVFNMGKPTIRWAGNENGLAEDPVEYVVNHTKMSNYTVVLSEFAENLYLPPECNVSIRRGWFWHPDDAPKTLEHLLGVYYRSVGLGCNLLINLPPMQNGQFDPADTQRMDEWRAELDRRFAHPLVATVTVQESLPGDAPGTTRWVARFPEEVLIDHLRLAESLEQGQRIAEHRVYANSALLCAGGSVGVSRLQVFERQKLRELSIVTAGESPQLVSVEGFLTGHSELPSIPEDYQAPTDYPVD
ncbi:alpha-L-fucosidase [Lysinibacter sp. HNR]|uniref:alpha-L-fucosidase n=1 Tax=Lysinibacter sp. HNR TaxID=3031408 RepID=UPI0024359D2D|nr:alpha-L-fucosidase [Lysinibacter sp. HNR]WGD38186.1 alpha-L-fucosidase [Lysinibacter sp. HNR]